MKWINKYLNPQDIKKIEEAVIRTEAKTCGEIVPVIVRSSSATGHVPLVLTLILTLFTVIAELPFIDVLWQKPWVYLWPLLVVGYYLLSLVLTRSFWIQKIFVSEQDELSQVHQRAELEFYRNRLDKTSARTGVLIFVSIMEKKAVILADEGIAKKLPSTTWNDVLDKLRKNLTAGKWSEGFIEAIEMSGAHLAEHFPVSEGGGRRDQLKNSLIVKP